MWSCIRLRDWCECFRNVIYSSFLSTGGGVSLYHYYLKSSYQAFDVTCFGLSIVFLQIRCHQHTEGFDYTYATSCKHCRLLLPDHTETELSHHRKYRFGFIRNVKMMKKKSAGSVSVVKNLMNSNRARRGGYSLRAIFLHCSALKHASHSIAVCLLQSPTQSVQLIN